MSVKNRRVLPRCILTVLKTTQLFFIYRDRILVYQAVHQTTAEWDDSVRSWNNSQVTSILSVQVWKSGFSLQFFRNRIHIHADNHYSGVDENWLYFHCTYIVTVAWVSTPWLSSIFRYDVRGAIHFDASWYQKEPLAEKSSTW